MADLLQFSAVHYNQHKFEQIGDVLCAPSGSLTARDIGEAKKRSIYNYAHLLFPNGSGDGICRNRTKVLYGWLLRDILLVDSAPGFYLYEQEFEFSGHIQKRFGLIALIGLDEVGKSIHSAKKAPEKLVEMNLKSFSESESVFENTLFLYKDRDRSIEQKLSEFAEKENLILNGKDEDRNVHRLYRVADENKIQEIREYFADQDLFLGEGQPNFEAAIQYRVQQQQILGDAYTGKESFNYLMGVLVNTDDPGFKMIPSHRLVKKESFDPVGFLKEIKKDYKLAAIELSEDIRVIKAARIKLKKVIHQYQQKGLPAFGVYFARIPRKYFVFVPKEETLKKIEDVNIPEEFRFLAPNVLSQTVLKPFLEIDEETGSSDLMYYQGEDRALDAVKRGEFDLTFIMGELDSALMVKSAEQQVVLSVKMTEFYPKILSGITAYSWKYSKGWRD